MTRVPGVAADLFPGAQSPPAWRVAVYVTLIWMSAALVKPELFRTGALTFDNDHALLSMDIAMARAYCDAPSKISSTIRIPYEVRDHPDLAAVPLRQLAVERAGSLAKYCNSIGSPVFNNENSLMWVITQILSLRPDLSFASLGQALHIIRLVGLLLFSGTLLLVGFGAVLTGAATVLALFLLDQLQSQAYSSYPFLLVLPLVTAALYTLAAKYGAIHSSAGAIVAAASAGLWTSFVVNMRTSHLPVYLAMALLFFALGDRALASIATPGSRALRVALVALFFALGYGAFQYLAIERHFEPPPFDPASGSPANRVNSLYHTFAHPLVLALGVPESELSRREGIRWSDGAGWELARRVDPKVPYMGPEYERVLLGYYANLWRRHPQEVFGVYVTKARIAGKQMIGVLRGQGGPEGRVARWLLAPLDLLPSGLFLLGLYVGVVGVTAVRAWRGSLTAQLMLYLGIAAVLMHLESVVIMSTYVPLYHAYLAFYCLFLSSAGLIYSTARILPLQVPARRVARR